MRILAKPPVVPVCALPVGVSVVVSNLKTIAALAGKLVPLIATGVPGGPVDGWRVPNEAPAVTVKVAVLSLVPTITVSVWFPVVAVAGIVIVLRKSPEHKVEV